MQYFSPHCSPSPFLFQIFGLEIALDCIFAIIFSWKLFLWNANITDQCRSDAKFYPLLTLCNVLYICSKLRVHTMHDSYSKRRTHCRHCIVQLKKFILNSGYILKCQNVKVTYPIKRPWNHAVILKNCIFFYSKSHTCLYAQFPWMILHFFSCFSAYLYFIWQLSRWTAAEHKIHSAIINFPQSYDLSPCFFHEYFHKLNFLPPPFF